MDQKFFPKELLNSSPDDRCKYFKNYTVSHPKFEKAFNELLDRVYSGLKNSIILVYGPTGAGKSRLVKKVKEKIIKDHLQLYQNDRGVIPILSVEAVPPDSGSFNWQDFYYRSLLKAEEPLIDYKISYVEEKVNNTVQLKKDTRAALRRSLESVLIFRKPLAFIIDEAQHISMTTNSRNLMNQINVLKTLTNITNVPIILIGNYDLVSYRNLNGQMIRRGKDIYIERYTNKEKDIQSFVNVLIAFQKHLPLEQEPELIDYWDYFYTHTIGCIGLLKDWFYLTYEHALKDNPDLKTLNIDHFKKYELLSSDKCLKLLKEVTEGEKKIGDSNDSETKLYRDLGLISGEENDQPVEEDKEKEDIKKNNKPGVRNATRDKVGIEELDEAQ